MLEVRRSTTVVGAKAQGDADPQVTNKLQVSSSRRSGDGDLGHLPESTILPGSFTAAETDAEPD